MTIDHIVTPAAPAAIGPYSQAVRAGSLIFVSGQLGLDPATGQFAGDGVEAQTEQALANIGEVLAAAGAGFGAVVKTTCMLADIADFAAMNAVYATRFAEGAPARSAFAVRDLPKGALVEIDVIAIVGG
jgi:2-iminobutanoate/2-iminopropanoate deaminase